MVGDEFINANALASLLIVASLLFTALSLATSLAAPGVRVRALPVSAPEVAASPA